MDQDTYGYIKDFKEYSNQELIKINGKLKSKFNLKEQEIDFKGDF